MSGRIREVVKLAPFWRYYGGKYRASPRYPPPEYTTIIEPFAGAAGYSTRYYDRQIILCEIYPVIAEIWRFLISASPEDVRSIPLVDSIKKLPSWVPDGARYLVGFSFNDATVSPSSILSAGRLKLESMGRKYEGWNFAKRERIARQVQFIKHWTVYECSYENLPDIEGTWFVDPPYSNKAGSYYIHSEVDYKHLADWCNKRTGQLIVCENEGADWLPFKRFYTFKAGINGAGSKEVVFVRNDKENSQVVHTCLKPVKRIGVDSDFPGFPSAIGLILRKGTNGYVLATHTPKLSSTVTGEGFEFNTDTHETLIDDLDTHLRACMIQQAHECRILAADLLEHAKRLEAESHKDVLIEEKNIDSALDNRLDSDPGKIRAKVRESTPSTLRVSKDDDLDLFD